MFHRKFDPDTTYFVADPHDYHANICRGTSKWTNGTTRDYNTIEEMSKALWDSLVLPKGSSLFILGDIMFGDKSRLPSLVEHIRQTCDKVYLIYGNHDDYIWKGWKQQDFSRLFDWCGHYLEICLGKRLVCIMHYPISSWRDSHHGSYMLSGHTHSSFPRLGKAIDLDWGRWKRPLSLREIDEMLQKIPINIVDHHNEGTN